MYQDDDIGYVIDDNSEEYIENNNQVDDVSIHEDYNDLSYENNNSKSSINKWIVIILAIVLIILIIILFMSRSKDEGIPNINIIDEQVYVKLENTINIPIQLENADNSNIEWQSLNEKLVTVDNNGNAFGVKLGKTTVLATYIHSNFQSYSDECDIYVYQGDKNSKLIDISVNNTLKIKKGNMANVEVSYNPSNAFIYSIEYKTSASDIASVDNGIISANNVGRATITVIVNENISKNIEVEVYEEDTKPENNDNNPVVNTKPTSVKFDNEKMNIMVNVTKKLSYKVSPSSSKNYKVTFENSNNTVLKVNSDGTIKGLSVGTSTVTIKVNDTLTDTIVVNVEPFVVNVEGITLKSSSNVNLNIGGTNQIKYEISPNDASNKVVTFHSNNNSVATVDENGLIKAVGSGNCVITVKTSNENKSVKINVNVN